MRHDLTLGSLDPAGPGLRLEPLSPQHADALLALVDDAAWFGFVTPPPRTAAEMRAWIDAAVSEPGKLAFAVVGREGDRPDGAEELRGTTSFYEYSPAQGRVEVGSTYYGRPWWGGRTNPAAKLLLLAHAFETWGLHRVALRADARNTRSLAAIERLGATREGVLRGHRVAADGTRGDTVYFSVLADEWPTVKAGLLARLDPDAPR